MTYRRSAIIWALGWLILSVVLLTIPGSSFPRANWYNKIWLDKWVHVVLFMVLVALWCRVVSVEKHSVRKSRNLLLCIMIAGIIYGIAMELVQKYLVPNRSFDGGDILADVAGCGIGFFYSWSRYIKK